MAKAARRLRSETVSLTLEVPTDSEDNVAEHSLDVSLAYDGDTILLREVVFVTRGKIGSGMNLLLHDLGIKLSRAIQRRDPDTGQEAGWLSPSA